MKIRYFLFVFSLIIALSCGQQRKKNFEASVETAQDAPLSFKDSLIQAEGDKAIGGIKFNTTSEKYNIDKELFLEGCAAPENDLYNGLYALGGYRFDLVNADFYKGKLYKIELIGSSLEYAEYPNKMPQQYEALLLLLTKKYGQPTEEHGLPAWSEFSIEHKARACCWWDLGSRTIAVYVVNHGAKYYLNLASVLPEKVKEKEASEESKSQEAAKKAADLL